MICKINNHLPGRPAERRNEIIDFVHGKILSGQIKPGGRLPIRRSLQKKFNSSMATVQQAIDRLVADGFIESRGVGGTFVSANPPHLNQFAVVISAACLDDSTPLFWKTMADAFSEMGRDPRMRIKVCYWAAEQNLTPDAVELIRNVSRRSIAGLVFITPPLSYENEKTRLINSGDIPCAVALMKEVAGKFNAGTLVLDEISYIRKSLEYFIGNGRRKIAVITNFRYNNWWENFESNAGRMGIETRPYWKICVSNEARGGLANIANMLMQLPKEKLPDALLIADDNLAKSVVDGLVDSGNSAVNRLKIVCHCNFPYKIHTQLPMKFLGYDSRQVAGTFMHILERQRKGEKAISIVENVKPVFDDEIGGTL
ncbi:MAG TPA: hypothetical protein DCZ94_03160 [Lentisphaeria bacterium]|nr:MAG: hypothetical protein A2X48_15990 [Lentisphaerae bacterium GWF2_49_21]HBC85933.1 hypothetical protein [Lentisphaeria bacterium]